MNIVFFHYHLKPGGVTTVIKHQLATLKDSCGMMIITGEKPQEKWPCPLSVIHELAYNNTAFPAKTINAVADKIMSSIKQIWPEGCDLIHVHNPLLAKNKNLLKILKQLQDRGVNLFLQIHDFAEDGRALAYFFDKYPDHCHYGVINSRDYHILLKSGLKPKGLHNISNIIIPQKIKEKPTSETDKLILYPVRAIRRKNIGEAILLSLFLTREEHIGITLPPGSQTEMLCYLKWKTFVSNHKLNVAFGLGLTHEFTQLLTQAKMIITTSITEGFGFSFLEPWALGKYLFGRKIPEICIDFEEKGLLLDHLYVQLRIPLKLINKKNLYNKWKAAIFKNCKIMNYTIRASEIEHAFAEITGQNCIDFGLLDEHFQKQIITLLTGNENHRSLLIDYNPWLSHFSDTKNTEKLIEHNKKIVLNHYTCTSYKDRLLNIYDKVIHVSVEQKIDKNSLLRSFFNLTDFSLLKWSNYADDKHNP